MDACSKRFPFRFRKILLSHWLRAVSIHPQSVSKLGFYRNLLIVLVLKFYVFCKYIRLVYVFSHYLRFGKVLNFSCVCEINNDDPLILLLAIPESAPN